MPYAHCLRVTMSSLSLERVCALWALESDKLLVYEHEADNSDKKIHCHILVEGARRVRKTFTNILQNIYPDAKGNKWVAGKTFDGNYMYVSYMSKGKYNPSYNKGYTSEFIEEWKNKWVAPTDLVKISKDVADYNNYMGESLVQDAFDIWKKDNPKWQEQFANIKSAKYKFLQKWCMGVAMERHTVINLQCMNMYTMLINTYCYLHSIPNPLFEKKINK